MNLNDISLMVLGKTTCMMIAQRDETVLFSYVTIPNNCHGNIVYIIIIIVMIIIYIYNYDNYNYNYNHNYESKMNFTHSNHNHEN